MTEIKSRNKWSAGYLDSQHPIKREFGLGPTEVNVTWDINLMNGEQCIDAHFTDAARDSMIPVGINKTPNRTSRNAANLLS